VSPSRWTSTLPLCVHRLCVSLFAFRSFVAGCAGDDVATAGVTVHAVRGDPLAVVREECAAAVAAVVGQRPGELGSCSLVGTAVATLAGGALVLALVLIAAAGLAGCAALDARHQRQRSIRSSNSSSSQIGQHSQPMCSVLM